MRTGEGKDGSPCAKCGKTFQIDGFCAFCYPTNADLIGLADFVPCEYGLKVVKKKEEEKKNDDH